MIVLLACTGPPDGATPPPPPPAWVDAAEPVACAGGADSPTYTDVAADWGLGGVANPDAVHTTGGGVAVADFDEDGDTDVVLAYRDAQPTLFRREGNAFVAETLPPSRLTTSSSAMPVDADGDGDWDLAVTGDTRLAWFRNEGGGAFVEDTTATLGELPIEGLLAPAPADFDLDGDVDLYLPVYKGSGTDRVDIVFANRGDGTYERADVLPPGDGGKTLQALWLDADSDGLPDAYTVNDIGQRDGGNALFLNDGAGGFTSGDDACYCAPAVGGMSADAGDVDGDGAVDLFLGNSDVCNLYLNDGSGFFVDEAVVRGATESVEEGDPDMVWAAILFDRDNDGDLDLFATHGDLWAPDDPASFLIDLPDSLLEQQADGTFEQVAPALGLDAMDSSRAVVAQDFNGDGVLDLLVTAIATDPHLWASTGCTDEGWLEVELVGTRSNLHGLGARVEIEAGGRTRVAWASSSSSVFAGKAPTLHFGLGDAQVVDRIRVDWPSGEVQEAEMALEARRSIVITE